MVNTAQENPLARPLDRLLYGSPLHKTGGKIVFIIILLVTASLVTAMCVSVSGIIGFVGLLIPHLMRFLTGPDNRRLIPVSLLAGAILLLCADTVTRAVLPSEIPIGVLTALIGGPFFCYIFRKRQMGAVD